MGNYRLTSSSFTREDARRPLRLSDITLERAFGEALIPPETLAFGFGNIIGDAEDCRFLFAGMPRGFSGAGATGQRR